MSFIIWILGTVVAITFIGDNPYVAIALAGLTGIAFALNSYLDYGSRAPVGVTKTEIPVDPKRGLAIRFGWLVDVAATLLLLFPTRWMALGFLLVLFSWLLRWWAQGKIIQRTVFDLPILGLWLMLPISLYASADVSVSVIALAQVTAGINAYYAIIPRVQTEEDLHKALAGFIALGVLLALMAPFAVEWIKTKAFIVPQFYTSLRQIWPQGIHPNIMAGALALVIPIGATVLLNAPLSWLSGKTRKIWRILLALGLGVMLVMLLATQSRGGIAAVLFGIFLLMAFKSRATLLAAVAGSISVAAFVATRYDLDRLGDAFFSTDTIPNLAGRLEIWSRAIHALQHVPYTGIGLGIFSRAVQVLYPLFLVGPDVDINYAHNIFLQVGVDLGMPGLVAYVGLLVLGLVVSWQAYRSACQQQRLDHAVLALGLCISLIVVMLHGVVDSAIWYTKPAILSWVLFAFIAIVDRQVSRRTLVEPAGLS